MIKRLIKKYKQLRIEETNNVLASQFAKAVFLMHEDLINEESKREPGEKDEERLQKLLLAETRKAKIIKGEKEIAEVVDNAKVQYIDVKPTLGRKAHREKDSVAVIDVAEIENKKVKKMKNEELLQQLDVLDGKIYREGRAKRNMQELLDLAHSKLKENSKSYDDLLELTMKLCKDYKKLAEFGQTNFPEVTGEQPQIDYSVLKKFEKNANLYQKSLKLNLIK